MSGLDIFDSAVMQGTCGFGEEADSGERFCGLSAVMATDHADRASNSERAEHLGLFPGARRPGRLPAGGHCELRPSGPAPFQNTFFYATVGNYATDFVESGNSIG